ncbi:MAG: hypothetical protein KGJ98_10130 [Chloroflexota bacterium]|nr:hypothetical protein [Chloroflexota bacterium]
MKQVTRADLQRQPASQLVPPGAEAIWTHQGSEYHMTIDGPYYADDNSLCGSRAVYQ